MQVRLLCAFIIFMISFGMITSKGQPSKDEIVSFKSKKLQYEGRIEIKKDAAYLYWPGSTVRLNFKGSAIKVSLQGFNGQNYFNVIIDKTVVKKIKIDPVKKMYTLAEGLKPGKHTIELFKCTQINEDYKRGYVKFFGFYLGEHAIPLTAPQVKKRKMEFYGNSITCGHAIEDSSGSDSGESIFENNYLSYAALTARHFNAQYHCIAESGIGLMAGFRKEIMPEIYNRINPFDTSSTWDFKRYRPDVVVVNLLQNDKAVLSQPQSAAFKRRFVNNPSEEEIIQAYQRFIFTIRSHYPKAYIICVLGDMDITQKGSPWPSYVKQAVANVKDKKVMTHFFAYKGMPAHPLMKDHEIMAASLVKFINDHVTW